MTQLIPAAQWRAAHWPVHDRTLRRAELDPTDPFPIVRINSRKYVRAAEAAAWLQRRAAAEHVETVEPVDLDEDLIARAHATGESLDALVAARARAGNPD